MEYKCSKNSFIIHNNFKRKNRSKTCHHHHYPTCKLNSAIIFLSRKIHKITIKNYSLEEPSQRSSALLKIKLKEIYKSWKGIGRPASSLKESGKEKWKEYSTIKCIKRPALMKDLNQTKQQMNSCMGKVLLIIFLNLIEDIVN